MPLIIAADIKLAEREAVRHEVYFLAANSRDSVKVRENRLEVKKLRETNASGVELWSPALVARFPVASDLLAPVWDAWRVARPEHAASLPSLSHLLNDFVAKMPSVRAVIVTKERARLTLPECRGEHAIVWVDGTRLETIAVEDEDPGRVLAAATRLGLTRLPNTSYPRALKAALGLPELSDSPIPEHI